MAIGGAGVAAAILPTLKGSDGRRIQTAAAVASILFHAFLLLFIFSSLSNATFSGGAGASGGDGQAMTVSLVGPLGRTGRQPAMQTVGQGQTATQLNRLLQQLRATQPATMAAKPRTHATLGELFEQLDAARSARHSDAGGAQGRSGAGDQAAAEQASKAGGENNSSNGVEGAAQERGDKGHASGDMWSQIETCPRPNTTVPVTLEIVVNALGHLTLPPRIIRMEGARLDADRLVAEARAVQAITDCAPFHSGAPLIGTRTYRFEFAAKP